jgi:Mitochondrial carrier protein
MLRDLPFSALQFAFYEQFKRWSNLMRRQWKGPAMRFSDHIPWEVVNGLAAGGLAGLITTPLGISPPFTMLTIDVVKTRIQTATRTSPTKSPEIASSQVPMAAGFLSQPKNIRTESVITALRHVYENEGWRGLFRGMGPRSGWCGSQSGVMFLGYEFFLRMLEKWDLSRQDIGI